MKLKPIIFIISAILVVIGALFKVMHWPGATLITEIGLGLGVFMLVYEIHTLKKNSNNN